VELETAQRSQTIYTAAREADANPNHWYAIARLDKLKSGKILTAKFWNQPLAVFRDETGQIRVVDDACPHKGVALHKGVVKGCHLVCQYHGWEFDGDSGECVAIPYLTQGQKLPKANVRSYPVQERYGLVWVFPGDPALANERTIIDIPEYDKDDWFLVRLEVSFGSHFSICNENAIDLFHGHLHRKYQAWYDTQLVKIQESPEMMQAQYDVAYQNPLAPLLGLSKWGIKETKGQITVRYLYPNLTSSLGDISRVYLLRLPASNTESRSFGLFFSKVKIPKILAPFKPLIRYVLRHFVLAKVVQQDIEMNENEQEIYQNDRDRSFVEVNPAIFTLRRLIVRQDEQYKAGVNTTLQKVKVGKPQ
jgi:phenylpropionate dioxygenase-like ring-hydroxylating dioxygenase large terminal subunit